jgi:hypothetical protein
MVGRHFWTWRWIIFIQICVMSLLHHYEDVHVSMVFSLLIPVKQASYSTNLRKMDFFFLFPFSFTRSNDHSLKKLENLVRWFKIDFFFNFLKNNFRTSIRMNLFIFLFYTRLIYVYKIVQKNYLISTDEQANSRILITIDKKVI